MAFKLAVKLPFLSRGEAAQQGAPRQRAPRAASGGILAAPLVIAEERNLVSLGLAVRSINGGNPALQELTDEISAISVQSGGSARQNAITAQLMMLTQRMAKNANAMLAEEIIDPEVSFLLGKDSNTYRDTLQGLLQGSEALRIARVSDAEMRGKLGELESAFKDYQRAVSEILGNMQRLVNAKRASRDMFNDSETLLGAAERLSGGYEDELSARRINFVAMGVVSVLAVLVLLLIGEAYVDDSRRRAEESERMNRSNQDAIVGLLDESGDLANGDLTARAKVTEDITGAIAASVNYTIDELRRLVTGITGAAQQVTAATQEAQTVTGQLLQAAQKQATEIQGTGQSVPRLAERSGDATKHIGAIVKSIQRDTQDAVEAMERSTRGVVEGTKTADEADQALREIEQVSSRLAELIGSISGATQQQAVSAAQVAGKMKIILGITQLTTEGTKKTAASAARLTALADGLKNSVAGFKLA